MMNLKVNNAKDCPLTYLMWCEVGRWWNVRGRRCRSVESSVVRRKDQGGGGGVKERMSLKGSDGRWVSCTLSSVTGMEMKLLAIQSRINNITPWKYLRVCRTVYALFYTIDIDRIYVPTIKWNNHPLDSPDWMGWCSQIRRTFLVLTSTWLVFFIRRIC